MPEKKNMFESTCQIIFFRLSPLLKEPCYLRNNVTVLNFEIGRLNRPEQQRKWKTQNIDESYCHIFLNWFLKFSFPSPNSFLDIFNWKTVIIKIARPSQAVQVR